MTVEERIARVQQKLDVMGIELINCKNDIVVYRTSDRLKAINCAINNGAIDKEYDHVEISRDFILCKTVLGVDKYDYDVYGKESTDLLLCIKSYLAGQTLGPVNIIPLDKDILCINTNEKASGTDKIKLVSAKGRMVDIKWHGKRKLVSMHTMKSRLGNISKISFTSDQEVVIVLDSDLNIIRKIDTPDIEVFDSEQKLRDIKSKLSLLDTPITSINDWAIVYKVGKEYNVVNYFIPNGTISKTYNDEVRLSETYMQCRSIRPDGSMELDIYCKNKSKCIKTFNMTSSQKSGIRVRVYELGNGLMCLTEKGEELSLNWHEYTCTLVNPDGKYAEVKFVGSEAEINYILGKYELKCGKLKLLSIDKELNILWQNKDARVDVKIYN